MPRTRIKFCGFTRAADVRAAVALGADAIGVVFDPRSRRCANAAQAREVRAVVPAFVTLVALLRDAEADAAAVAIAALQPDLLQFHGDEPPAECARWGLPWIKAVPMATPQDLPDWIARYAGARALLLDAHAPGQGGGTGARFDWTAVPRAPALPLVLAGGLTPDNVGQAIRIARPYAVDVSSGIESAPGVKDSDRMQRFAAAVRQADDSGANQ